MARTALVARDEQRRLVVARYAARRAALKRAAVSPHVPADERARARAALAALPRDASPVRLRNRDAVDGRPRAYHRTFGLSRIRLRQAALRGELPGVTKSSW